MEQRVPFRVVVVLALGLVAFASSAILIRYAKSFDAPPLAIAFWRTSLGALLLVPLALSSARGDLRRLTGRDWLFITGAALLLSAHFVTWILSLFYTSVASATVLVTTSPIFLALFGFLILRERYRWPLYGAIVVGVVGAVLLATEAPSRLAPDPVLGNSLALSAALFMTLYLIVGQVVRKRLSFLAYVFPLYALIAVFVGVAAWASGAQLLGLDGRVYLFCLLMALGPQLLGHGSFNYALRYVSAVMLGLLSLTEPIGATLAAYVLFGEAPGLAGAIGMAATLLAVAMAVWFEHRGRRTKPLVETGQG